MPDATQQLPKPKTASLSGAVAAKPRGLPSSAPKTCGPPVIITLDATAHSREDGTLAAASPRSARAINHFLHHDVPARGIGMVRIEHPGGAHNLAVGLDYPVDVQILGHAGYYAGGMNKQASIVVRGNAERGVAENMMSGTVRVTGNASECAGASAHGGLLIVEGDAAGRCGISLKGGDIVVGGSVGHAAMFMAQAGRLLVCGDAGPGLGDSLYEAVIYIGGNIEGLGADAREEPMTDVDFVAVSDLLLRAGLTDSVHREPAGFKKVTSARGLYHWHSANHGAY